jgi:2-oxoglutarate dehydrogenase E1 component
MLRLKAASSKVEDFTTGSFQPVIDDERGLNKSNVKRVLFCSGKIYWDLLAEAEKRNDQHTAIVRVEQLYPTPVDEIKAVYAQYPGAELFWVQDEPANQGPWPHIALSTTQAIGGTAIDDRVLRRISRRAAASPATGNHHLHEDEAKALLVEAFTR